MVVSTLLMFSDPYFSNKFPFWPPSLLSQVRVVCYRAIRRGAGTWALLSYQP